ncbi:Transglycosylase SLT domain-containing protein [Lacicoccus alkaliphilus]|uniref:Transglycosylase SLT domain-containing protein n=2 Tax=Lacicoccus TaxID=3076172 RepID=A0A1M7GTA3_9BACL|nr:hypothetical protein [Salinicoccus alkaliphilus]SHM19079.1 hypothetical protein SAMN02745189_01726 [Salinicoccus alkaliphilus DSM 16010]
MKKTILTTTLALGLGIGGFTAAGDAEASEQNIDKAELAQMAQSHSSKLDEAPIHEGEYHYNFNLNEVDYEFKSDGVNYTWAYNGNGPVQAETPAGNAEQAAPQVTESPVQEEQPAPEVVEETQEAPAQNVQQPEQESQPAAPSSDGSTKEQFLEAGGTEAVWNAIVMPESSGDPNAVNELGYRGLGQTKESWGTGSVTEQTEGMLNYAEERYGSVEEAIEFREANNWW